MIRHDWGKLWGMQSRNEAAHPFLAPPARIFTAAVLRFSQWIADQCVAEGPVCAPGHPPPLLPAATLPARRPLAGLVSSLHCQSAHSNSFL